MRLSTQEFIMKINKRFFRQTFNDLMIFFFFCLSLSVEIDRTRTKSTIIYRWANNALWRMRRTLLTANWRRRSTLTSLKAIAPLVIWDRPSHECVLKRLVVVIKRPVRRLGFVWWSARPSSLSRRRWFATAGDPATLFASDSRGGCPRRCAAGRSRADERVDNFYASRQRIRRDT